MRSWTWREIALAPVMLLLGGALTVVVPLAFFGGVALLGEGYRHFPSARPGHPVCVQWRMNDGHDGPRIGELIETCTYVTERAIGSAL